jgi:hypothetical protein
VLTFVAHNWEELQDEDPTWMKVLEYVTGVIFTVDYITRFYAAPDRLQYTIGFFSVIDLLTVAPVWIELGLSEAGVDAGNARTYLRPIRVLRALRVLRAYRILNFLDTEFEKQLFLTLLMLISIILCSAGIVQAIELCDPPLAYANATLITITDDYVATSCKDPAHEDPCCQSMPFYTLIYFIIVTITTVGYGDFSPKSTIGRVFVMLMIILTFALFPIQVGQLGELMKRQDKYSGASFKKKRRQEHVVLCGEVNADSLRYFLREIFHHEAGIHVSTVIVLCPNKPDTAIETVLCHPLYETRVKWLEGSAMLDMDLHRAEVEHCSACFVMVDKNASESEIMESDDLVNLITMSICHWNPNIPIFTQALTSANSRRLLVAGAHSVACVEELRLNILARSTVVQGLATLVSNLLSSISAQDQKKLLKEGRMKQVPWVREYLSGCCQEIVRFRVGANLEGTSFKEAARILQAECSCILFAMLDDASDFTGKAESRAVRLFPASRTLLFDDFCYVLAKNPFIVDEIAGDLIHSSHTLLSYAPLIHSTHTLLSYTPLIHSSHTLYYARFKPTVHELHALMAEFDVDGDGSIGLNEFCEVMASIKG